MHLYRRRPRLRSDLIRFYRQRRWNYLLLEYICEPMIASRRYHVRRGAFPILLDGGKGGGWWKISIGERAGCYLFCVWQAARRRIGKASRQRGGHGQETRANKKAERTKFVRLEEGTSRFSYLKIHNSPLFAARLNRSIVNPFYSLLFRARPRITRREYGSGGSTRLRRPRRRFALFNASTPVG